MRSSEAGASMAAPVDSRTLSKTSRKVASSAVIDSAPSSYTATTGRGGNGCSDGGAGTVADLRTCCLGRRAC
jgi:hypothetical protein